MNILTHTNILTKRKNETRKFKNLCKNTDTHIYVHIKKNNQSHKITLTLSPKDTQIYKIKSHTYLYPYIIKQV